MEGKDILIWLGIFIIGSLIVSAIIDPSIIPDFKDKSDISFNTQTKTNDPLVDSCTIKFNECKNIGESKYNLNVKLQEKQRFGDISGAENFFNTWSGVRQGTGINWYASEVSFPIVLFATKINIKEGLEEVTYPYVVFCSSNGELTPKTKSGIGC